MTGLDDAGSPAPGTAEQSITVTVPSPETESRKAPPPENPSDASRRSLVILSFWTIVVFLGLPIWWKTTTIYRANLPLSGMVDWADGKVVSSYAFDVAFLISNPANCCLC